MIYNREISMNRLDRAILDQAIKHNSKSEDKWYYNTNYLAMLMVAVFMAVIGVIQG